MRPSTLTHRPPGTLLALCSLPDKHSCPFVWGCRAVLTTSPAYYKHTALGHPPSIPPTPPLISVALAPRSSEDGQPNLCYVLVFVPGRPHHYPLHATHMDEADILGTGLPLFPTEALLRGLLLFLKNQLGDRLPPDPGQEGRGVFPQLMQK